MKITRPKVLRALPTIAANVVALVCAVEFDWPVVTLFLLFILETWFMIALESVRVALDPRDGIMGAIRAFVVPSMFVAIQLAAAILILDAKGFAAQASGDLVVDFPRYVGSLGLAWPLAAVAAVRVATFARDVARDPPTENEAFVRIFVMIGLFIFALGPTSVMAGRQWWALVALATIKASFEVWWTETTREYAAWVASIEKERRDYQASLDPRGMGTWPTPRPPVNRP